MSTEPTSGNEQPEFAPDTEAIEAQEKADAEAERIAEEHLFKPEGGEVDPNDAYKAYDAQGKGEDYEPKGSPTLEAAEAEEKSAKRSAAKDSVEAKASTVKSGTRDQPTRQSKP